MQPNSTSDRDEKRPARARLVSRSVLGSFRVDRGSPCAACGREVGLLEERHVVEGRSYHTVCVPHSR